MLDRVRKKAVKFANLTYASDWETLAQRRTVARLCALLKAYNGKRAWKAIGVMLHRPYYLSRADHARNIRDRKQRTDIGIYSFVNRTIKSGINYLQKSWETSHENLTFLEREFGKQL